MSANEFFGKLDAEERAKAIERFSELLKDSRALREIVLNEAAKRVAKRLLENFRSSPLGVPWTPPPITDSVKQKLANDGARLGKTPSMEVLPVSLDEAGQEPVHSPIVGEAYWHSVVVTTHEWMGMANRVVPITGPLHEDAEIINFPHQHWHIDWRFADEALIWDAAERRGQHPSIIVLRLDDVHQDLKVLRVRKRCQRRMPRFPSVNISWARPLEEKYAKAKMKCLTCPHRGMALDPATADANGVVRCPAHGLQWELGTGSLVPAISPTATWNWSLGEPRPEWKEVAP